MNIHLNNINKKFIYPKKNNVMNDCCEHNLMYPLIIESQKSQSGRRILEVESTTLLTEKSNLIPFSVNGIGFNMIACVTNKHRTKESKSKNLNNFMLGETEVTQELFESIMGFNYSAFDSSSGYGDRSKHPVETVSWYDCISFCNKLSCYFDLVAYYDITGIEKGGRNAIYGYIEGETIKKAVVKENPKANGFRLPYGIEWLYAAKAGTQNRYAGFDNDNDLWRFCWVKMSARDKTHPVAQKLPNEWGFYDMNGNVREWIWDNYIPEPTDSININDEYKHCLGGGLDSLSSELSLVVGSDSLYAKAPEGRSFSVGFRIAANFQ
jgi:formylglycine-generating enzyme required for sulfatase activity